METTKTEIYRRADGTTCPLTCSKCGQLIERNTPMQWERNRAGGRIRRFWHTGCNRAVRNGRRKELSYDND